MTAKTYPAPAWRAAGQNPWERYHETGSLAGMRIGAYVRVSRKATKTELEIARRGGRDFDKSTDDQDALAALWEAKNPGVILVPYGDIGISGKDVTRRKSFRQMLRDAQDGHLDGLWFAFLDRSARAVEVTVQLVNLSRDDGLLIIVRDDVLDPKRDRLSTIIRGAIDEDKLSEMVEHSKVGREANRDQGYPYGPVSYGWERVKHPGTEHLQLYQSLKIQRPDGLLPGTVLLPGGHGLGPRETPREPGQPPRLDQLVPDSAAYIVAQMFTRYADGWYDEQIAADLNARGIPVSGKPGEGTASGSPKWRGSRVRAILVNAQYAGYMTVKGKIVDGVYGRWVPLVSTTLFWACQNRRAAKRGQYRDGGGPYMMASTARCGKCGSARTGCWADHDQAEGSEGARLHYTCTETGCWGSSIGQVALDNEVDDRMVTYLSDPAVQAHLAQARDAEAQEAAAVLRAQADQKRTELRNLLADVAAGRVSARMGTAREAVLEEEILADEQAAASIGLPELLRKLVNPDHPDEAAKAWVKLDPLGKRAVIRLVAVVHIKPVGRGRNNQFAARDDTASRLHWQWLIGPDAGDGEYVLPEARPRNTSQVTVHGKVLPDSYTTAEKGELALRLMAEHGWNMTACSVAMGTDKSAVRYWLRKAAEARGEAYRPPPKTAPRRPSRTLTITLPDGTVTEASGLSTADKGRLAAALMAEHGLNLSQCARAMGVTAPGVSYWLRAAAVAASGAAVTTA
jgi:DNA invertase Pin-like site-specific DNA recombinase